MREKLYREVISVMLSTIDFIFYTYMHIKFSDIPVKNW